MRHLAHAFARARDWKVGGHDICEAFDWDEKEQDATPFLVAHRPFGTPRVIGKLVLRSGAVDRDSQTERMQLGHGETRAYERPEITMLGAAELATSIKSPAAAEVLGSLLETPDLADNDGRKSEISVYECELAGQTLYAFSYMNTTKVGQTPDERAILSVDYLRFFDEAGHELSMQELDEILRQDNGGPQQASTEAALS